VTRVGFRFFVVYLGLFSLATQITGSLLPNTFFYYRGLGPLWPMRDITTLTGRYLFGVEVPPGAAGTGGEPLAFWIQWSWILLASIAATIAWSIASRPGAEYTRLHAWFRLFVRIALAASLFEYGMTKVVPTQFPAPSLTTLVTPVGDLTLSALLWTTIGASPAYQIATGCVEVLGGILLLAPRTTMAGALISVAAAAHVLLLNLTFDIGVKLVSFHLVIMAAFLLAPGARRLVSVLLRNRPDTSADDAAIARTPGGRRAAVAAPMLIGAALLAMFTYINVRFWYAGGGGAPRSPLYGIWQVERLSVDGVVREPHLNDYDNRWRRVIFDAPDSVVVQRTDDSFGRFGTSVDDRSRTLIMTKGGSRTWRGAFRYDRPETDRLVLDGEMDGSRIRVELRRVELDTFRLINSPFRWIRPHGRSMD
jgi:hypothetical protein